MIFLIAGVISHSLAGHHWRISLGFFGVTDDVEQVGVAGADGGSASDEWPMGGRGGERPIPPTARVMFRRTGARSPSLVFGGVGRLITVKGITVNGRMGRPFAYFVYGEESLAVTSEAPSLSVRGARYSPADNGIVIMIILITVTLTPGILTS